MAIEIIPENPRIALAGSVNSSRKVLKKLIEHNMNLIQVLGLDPEASKNVSGFNDLKPIAENAEKAFRFFKKLNDPEIVSLLRNREIDLLFVVGLSQLVKRELLEVPSVGCIGYHPTLLPQGRGRAAIAWIILEGISAAASFFMLDEGADSGPLIIQEPVEIDGTEYPQEIIDKVLVGIDSAMDKLLPQLKKGELQVQKQDESKATYLGRRKPIDGYIKWNQPAQEIALLVRAVSKPLPGAFTYYKSNRITIWKATARENSNYFGVPGRILEVNDDAFLVCTGEGILEVEKYDGNTSVIRKGRKLGIDFIEMYESYYEQQG